jgi:hypothetical protein
MPNKISPAEAQKCFRDLVEKQYDLESDFIDKLCEFFAVAAEKLGSGTVAKASKASPAAAGKPKQRRKKSAYNLYVREMMKTDEIQQLDHHEKMGAIARQWKSLSAEDKVEYTDMAATENSAAAEAEAADE